MYEVMIKSEFSAAHSLREYEGKCEALHGHNFRVDVYAGAEEVDGTGLTIDFRILKEKTNVILDQLDHKHLNDLPYFTETNPSSENIAAYIFNNLKGEFSNENVVLNRVAVWESENSCATYSEK